MKSAVYAITHTATNRHYVGSSRDVRARFKAHRSMLRLGRHHSPHLQRAWDIYGEGAFAFCVVEVVRIDDLLQMEQVWMDRLHANDPRRGFNVAEVAGTRVGVPHSEEARRKMSAARKGKPKSPEHAAKIGAANKGKVRTPEMRAVTAAIVSAAMADPARRVASAKGGAKIGGWNKGLSPSDEAREKMSASAKRKRLTRDEKGRIVTVGVH